MTEHGHCIGKDPGKNCLDALWNMQNPRMVLSSPTVHSFRFRNIRRRSILPWEVLAGTNPWPGREISSEPNPQGGDCCICDKEIEADRQQRISQFITNSMIHD